MVVLHCGLEHGMAWRVGVTESLGLFFGPGGWERGGNGVGDFDGVLDERLQTATERAWQLEDDGLLCGSSSIKKQQRGSLEKCRASICLVTMN